MLQLMLQLQTFVGEQDEEHGACYMLFMLSSPLAR